MNTLNKEIARKYFISLVLDYEFTAADGLPAYVSCRVLNDQNYIGYITAETREEAVRKFYAGDINTK